MRESDIDKAIIKWINSLEHGRAIKLVAMGQGRGEPDIIATIGNPGRMVVIETKTPVGRLTVIQRHVLKQWREAGAIAIVATSLLEAQKQLVQPRGLAGTLKAKHPSTPRKGATHDT